MLWLETLLTVGTEGCSAVLPVFGMCALLTMIIPGKHVTGYACDRRREGIPLDYKLNGLSVMLLLVAGWFQVGHPTYLAEKFWSCFGVAFGLGMIGSAYCVWIGSKHPEKYSRCATADNKPKKLPKASSKDLETWNSRTTLGHFFYGMEFNPRWNFPGLPPLDVKMYLYVFGATYLALNVLSAVALQATLLANNEGTSSTSSGCWSLVTQHSSTGTKLYTWMMGWFLCDYLWFEELHLYTYDLFCEKLGFKLFWGCTCFYPFFYCVGIWSLLGTTDDIQDLSSGQVVRILMVFYAGWILTRGSNLQKFWFKQALREQQQKSGCSKETILPPCFWGLVPQKQIRPGSALLCSGFWGLSRHINYLGETLQAVALALPGYMARGSFLPFLYPLYYVALFVPRAMDDGSICAAKYGAEWEEYVQKVPYKIVPGIY